MGRKTRFYLAFYFGLLSAGPILAADREVQESDFTGPSFAPACEKLHHQLSVHAYDYLDKVPLEPRGNPVPAKTIVLRWVDFGDFSLPLPAILYDVSTSMVASQPTLMLTSKQGFVVAMTVSDRDTKVESESPTYQLFGTGASEIDVRIAGFKARRSDLHCFSPTARTVGVALLDKKMWLNAEFAAEPISLYVHDENPKATILTRTPPRKPKNRELSVEVETAQSHYVFVYIFEDRDHFDLVSDQLIAEIFKQSKVGLDPKLFNDNLAAAITKFSKPEAKTHRRKPLERDT